MGGGDVVVGGGGGGNAETGSAVEDRPATASAVVGSGMRSAVALLVSTAVDEIEAVVGSSMRSAVALLASAEVDGIEVEVAGSTEVWAWLV